MAASTGTEDQDVTISALPITANATTLPRLLDPKLAHLRDVTLIPAKSPGRTIRAHRFVLAAASPVLRASLAADPQSSVLTLAHADADALDAALQFVYGCDDAVNNLPPHTLWTAFTTCIAYAIPQPLDAVQSRIISSLTVDNVLYHWEMAEKYNLDAVQIRCRNLIKEQFVHVSKQPDFLDLCAPRLAKLLRIHDLIVSTEYDIFQALERWLAFDVVARIQNALNLLRLVRLPTIPDRILLRVCRSPYFGGHNEFYQLLLEALIRRTEVRIVHAPRIATMERRWRKDYGTTGDYSTNFVFKPLGITDQQLLPTKRTIQRKESSRIGQGSTTTSGLEEKKIDYNRVEDRSLLFQGLFPLKWYKSARFRPRSSSSLLFTVVIPKWSLCRRRFMSESRSFLNHKWSIWVDPYASESTPNTKQSSKLKDTTTSKYTATKYISSSKDGRSFIRSESDPGSKQLGLIHGGDDTDYISIYLCCESELGGSDKVDVRVDFGLFIVASTEEYGMERKVGISHQFTKNRQATGFRRHIRRSKLHSVSGGLYDWQKDELVVGAHLIASDGYKSQLEESSLVYSTQHTSGIEDFRSESPLSPLPPPFDASRMTTMETDPSPILTTTTTK